MKPTLLSTFVFALLNAAYCASAMAADWPMWRGDASRSAATSEQLAADLHLQWSLKRSALKPAWPEDVRLQFDASFEPIVMGKTMYVSSSTNDSVSAYDLDSGKRLWRFFPDGPVRFAPVAAEGYVYAGSDDGKLYCLDAKSGELVWRVNAAPSNRLAIGSERLVSVWPVRGGPVLVGNRLYFTSGVWPFEGTSIHSLDTNTIDLDAIGSSRELSADHLTSSGLKNLAPQGYLAASGKNLYIPCGRGNVFAIDRTAGKSVPVKYSAKGLTDYHAAASDNWVFHGDKVVDVAGGGELSIAAHRPVAHDGTIYFTNKGKAVAFDLKNQETVEKKDRRGKTVQVKVPRQLWSLDGQPITTIHLKAGNRLYSHQKNTVVAIDIPAAEGKAGVSWTATVEGTPSSMLAASGKLIVVTKEGGIHCFGEADVEAKTHVEGESPLASANDEWTKKAETILKQPGASEGYCVALGVGSGRLIEELIRQSRLHIVVVDQDKQKVDSLRRRMDALGLYGSRVVAQVGDPLEVNLPPYMANLIVSENGNDAGIGRSQFAQKMFQALRPYGGTAYLESSTEQHALLAAAGSTLQNASIERAGEATILTRVGALPGSADWTHEFGSAANTLKSDEKLVKAPLGVLWYGGPASDGSLFYDRHEWGPSIAVKDGRMFIQGPGKLTAVDVYTGRILWQNKIPKGKSPGRGSNWGPTGYHFVIADDAFYLTHLDKCARIDPATGKQLSTFALPDSKDRWGRIRVWKNQIIAAVFTETEEHGVRPSKLVSVDRHTGKILWTKESDLSFPLIAIGQGKVFCFEGRLEGLYVGNSKTRIRGVPKSDAFLYVNAFDAKSGKPLWRNTTSRSASWVSYSEKHDVLLVSNKHGIDAWQGKSGGELWNKVAEGKGFLGHPENYWDKVIIWNDRIIDQRGPGTAYDIRTGEPIMQPHPITGKNEPWTFTKSGHHCNYAIASEHLMTFRAASAGFCDLASGDTGRLEGFRPGCRNSLIPANGVLNAPNMAHGCVCSYSIFTSLALVHVPQTELWTYSDQKASDGPVKQLGINFGAVGDRQAENGTLWLNYPNQSSGSPLKFPVKVSSDKLKLFRVHSSTIQGEALPWVASSGIRGVKSVTVPVVSGKAPGADSERSYTVRLYFAEPDTIALGENVFDVTVQGDQVLRDFDVVREAKGLKKSVVREFAGVKATREMKITFAATHGNALISGIEVMAE